MRIFSFKNFRILVLLLILAAVASYVKDQKLVTQGWYKTLDIVVYPINPTNSPIVQRYIDSLSVESFSKIDKFIKRESEKYNIVSSTPTKTKLGETLTLIPPEPPGLGSNTLDIILWSLKLRYWIWKNAPDEDNSKYLVRMFVLYHDPSVMPKLKHSVGLQKGLVGIVNGFGVKSQEKQNSIVIAHEFFHTVGASDKYNEFGDPIFPDGLGNPNQSPLYPQKKTELMAGRRALSESHSEMPNSFRKIVIGEKTAREIGWLSDI
ncbi:MAG: hypothetical protein AB8B89_09950 [Gammaproteobacteria bacterium]